MVKNVILFILSIIIIIMLLFKGQTTTQTKIVDRIIQGKTDTITLYKDSIQKEIQYIYKYEKYIDTVKQILEVAKIDKDTVKIIVVQDSIIKMQGNEIKHLFNTVDLQSNVIVNLEDIDSLRVQENEQLKQDNKRVKLKLVGTTIIAIGVTAIAIFKK